MAHWVLEHGGSSQSLAFSDNSRLLVVASRGDTRSSENPDGGFIDHHTPGVAVVWELESGAEIARFQDHNFFELEFCPGVETLATGGEAGIRLWDARLGRLLQTLPVQNCTGFSVSPDGRQIAIGFCGWPDDAKVILLDRESGHQVLVLRTPDEDIATTVYRMRFLANGRLLAGLREEYGNEGKLYIWDLKSQETLVWFTGHDSCECSVLSPTGKLFSTAQHDEVEVYVWRFNLDRQAGLPPWELAFRLGRQPTVYVPWMPQMAFSPDESILAILAPESFDTQEEPQPIEYSVRLRDLKSGCEVDQLAVRGKASGMAWSPNGEVLAVASWEGEQQRLDGVGMNLVSLWDVPAGRCLGTIPTPSRQAHRCYDPPKTVLFSPDGRWLAVGYDRYVELWEVSGFAT